MKKLIFNDNNYQENAYLLIDHDDALVIDIGPNISKIEEYLTINNLRLTKILLTHGHFDHTMDLSKIDSDVEVYIHELEKNFLFDKSKSFAHIKLSDKIKIVTFKDLDEIVFGKNKIKVYHTPGHTIGSSCFYINNWLFSGDTLFKEGIGRTDLPTGNNKDIYKSLKFILTHFSKEVKVFPGHNEETTIKEEIDNNQFIK